MSNTNTLDARGRVNPRVAFRCCKCNQVFPKKTDGGTGYATNRKNGKICYKCCGIIDRKDLQSVPVGSYVKSVVLYVGGTDVSPTVSNWPGTLETVVVSSWHVRTMSRTSVTKGLRVTFTVVSGSTTDGTFRRHGTFTGMLLTSVGNYLARVRRIK